MQITYSRKVKFLEDTRATKREYPNEHKMIDRRLGELKQAKTVRDLHYGNPHPLKGNMQGLISTAPGESLYEVMEVEGFTAEQAAETSGIPYPVFLGVLNGAVPITEDIAQKLTKVARYPVYFWLNGEKRYQYDLKRLGWQRPTCPETEQYYTANEQA